VLAILLVAGLSAWLGNTAVVAQTVGFETLNGSGSSWAGPAIDQWSKDVRSRGIVINYNATGSQQGRSDFTGNLKDFAGSDIAFLNGEDKIAGGLVETPQYGYSYVPITAGGTAFMYHLTVGGKRVTDLKLTGDTITKIFTGQITNWADPAITKDYGKALPSKPIVPVTRSDGSGATAQFTAWMNDQYPDQWAAFCAKYANTTDNPCGETEFYPTFPNGKPQGNSTAVANYIAAEKYGEGAIGYDEYAYALTVNYPVVKVANKAGYFTLPTAQNVAVALTKAEINQDKSSIDYLTQDLRKVYVNEDPRAYPLSSYSYLIVPRTGDKPVPPKWSAGKGATMSAFADYFLCTGQAQMEALGYSPLPQNLVQGAFDQIAAMPYAQQTPARNDLAKCNNPTLKDGRNVLLETAPQPSPCDKVGAPPTCGTAAAAGPKSGDKKSGSTGTAATGQAGATGAVDPGAGNAVDPDTGQVQAAGDQTSGGVPAQAVLVGSIHNNRWLPAVITGLALLGVVALPPSLSVYSRRRR
jgi:ABC-type phosphate transport system substrate-binding protein